MQTDAWGNLILQAAQRAARIVVRRFTTFAPEVEEISAEVAARLTRRYPATDPAPPSFVALRSIAVAAARNCCVDRLRRTRAGDRSAIEAARGNEQRQGHDEPVHDAELDDLIAILTAALTADQRRLVHLRFIEERTFRDIAHSTALPEATVRRRIEEAVQIMERIRREWEGEGS